MKGTKTFPTRSRIHMGLRVCDLEAALKFYGRLFGQEATKVRPGYAKFEVVEPPVNFTLNEADGPVGGPGNVNHFGIQLQDTDELESVRARLKEAGMTTRDEADATCCYARQEKVWVTDPDGNPWEFFVVLGDAGVPATKCCS